MDKFLSTSDELSQIIQANAVLLYDKLRTLPVDDLGMPHYCLVYFKGSHFKRLFFSIETSANLLYRSISAVNKPVSEIVIMDYGAGVGTLYTLAKMIGCKKVIYNDYLEDWRNSARLIAEAIGIHTDEYILGDIGETLKTLDQKNIQCDIIASRNVIEHIYKLDEFYLAIAAAQPKTLIYSSTTANSKNPATRIQHRRLHRKWEKIYLPQREQMILQIAPSLDKSRAHQLALHTKGLAGSDINHAVEKYLSSGKLPDPLPHRTNTCNPTNGVWAEHLLRFDEYRKLLGNRYEVSFEPGFWDTHYQNPLMNMIGKLLNGLIRMNKTMGFFLASFIYVVASPKK